MTQSNILKQKIITTLRSTSYPNIDKLLQYMDKNGYFTCKSSSHNHWEGGAAEHMWATYIMAKALRNQRIADPDVKKNATDAKLAIVCLLHDLCDMHVKVITDRGENVSCEHGHKSCWIMRNFKVGTIAECEAVKNHMHANKRASFKDLNLMNEYQVLHSLICSVDYKASGTAWNSLRYKSQKTQHHGIRKKDFGYLNAVALDRTSQCCSFKMYVDENYNLQEFNNYNRNDIQWNFEEDIVARLKNNKIPHLGFDDNTDSITKAHSLHANNSKRLCLVVGISDRRPSDGNTRLRQSHPDEQSVLICSNLLLSMYKCEKDYTKGRKRYRMKFTMRNEIKSMYEDKKKLRKGLFFPHVTMIRNGMTEGYSMVKPWTVDIFMVPGIDFKPFITYTNSIFE